MILKESELYDQDLISPLLGKPYKEPGKLFTATGSSYFFVKEITDLDGNPLPLKRDEMKAIFQRYEKGLYLHLNKSNYQNAILIPHNCIDRITLTNLIEERNIWNHSLLKVLIFISDLPVIGMLANFLRYKTRETVLSIQTDTLKARMITSFSSFNSQVRYFSKIGLKDRFQVKQ